MDVTDHKKSTKRISLTESDSLSEDSSRNSSCSYNFDVVDLLTNTAEGYANFTVNEDVSQAIDFLLNNMIEFSEILTSLITTKMEMEIKTPEGISQHFDLAFKHVESMYHFQQRTINNIKKAKGNLEEIGIIFCDDNFVLFKQFLIMTPGIQKDIRTFEDHFRENFPYFKSNIVRPSLRLSFYANFIQSLIKLAKSRRENEQLEKALFYIEALKQDANLEMTLSSIKNSPIDLRLGGKIIHLGELFYISGPLNKKKVLLIVFENVLVITTNKMAHFNYQAHYRVDQLCHIGIDPDGNLILAISDAKKQISIHKFRNSLPDVIHQWEVVLQQWLDDNQASYEITQSNSDNHGNKNTNRMLPLDLWQVFPMLKDAWNEIQNPSETNLSTYNIFEELLQEEEKYVKRLEKLLDPETIPPPEDLVALIRKLITFHRDYFLPEIKEAYEINHRNVVSRLQNALHGLSIYQTYLETRCWMTICLRDGAHAFMYISPVHQLAFYLRWLKKLELYHSKYETQSRNALDCLKRYITDARVRILHDAIGNCRLDFYRTGDMKKRDKFEMKSKSRGFKNGDYIVILFEKVILLTRPSPPRYHLVRDIWMDQINFGPPSDNLISFKIELRMGKEKSPVTFEFKSDREQTRNEWVKLINTELNNIATEIKRKTSMEHFESCW